MNVECVVVLNFIFWTFWNDYFLEIMCSCLFLPVQGHGRGFQGQEGMIRYLKRASDCTSTQQSNFRILLYPAWLDSDFIWLFWVNLWGQWPDWAMNVFDIRQRWVSNPEHCNVTDMHGRSKKLGILAINVIIALKSTCGVDSCIFDQWAQPIDLVSATHCELIGTECLRLNRHNQMFCYFSIAQ